MRLPRLSGDPLGDQMVRAVARSIEWAAIVTLSVVASLPFAWYVAVFSEAVRAWRFLGHWPLYDRPDPKSLPPQVQVAPVDLLLAAAVLVAFGYVTAVAVRTRRPWWRVGYVGAAVIVMWAGFYLLLRVDPGGMVEWIMD